MFACRRKIGSPKRRMPWKWGWQRRRRRRAITSSRPLLAVVVVGGGRIGDDIREMCCWLREKKHRRTGEQTNANNKRQQAACRRRCGGKKCWFAADDYDAQRLLAMQCYFIYSSACSTYCTAKCSVTAGAQQKLSKPIISIKSHAKRARPGYAVVLSKPNSVLCVGNHSRCISEFHKSGRVQWSSWESVRVTLGSEIF